MDHRHSSTRPSIADHMEFNKSRIKTPAHDIRGSIRSVQPKNRATTSIGDYRKFSTSMNQDMKTKSSLNQTNIQNQGRSFSTAKSHLKSLLHKKLVESRRLQQSKMSIRLNKEGKVIVRNDIGKGNLSNDLNKIAEVFNFGRPVEAVKKEYKDKFSFEKIDEIQTANRKMREAIEAYIDLIKIGEETDVTLEDVVKEHKDRDERNQENFYKREELEKFRKHSKIVSLFLKKLGRRKIWKPNKFAPSRKVKIAESFDQLIG